MNNKAMGLLGLAARARKVISGEGVLTSIQNGSAKLVLIASDASENTKKKYVDKCTYYNVEFDFVETSAELNQARVLSIGKSLPLLTRVLRRIFILA